MDPQAKTNNGPKLDYSITKKCEVCKKDYHPRDNGYQYTSKYCGQNCMIKARRAAAAKTIKKY